MQPLLSGSSGRCVSTTSRTTHHPNPQHRTTPKRLVEHRHHTGLQRRTYLRLNHRQSHLHHLHLRAAVKLHRPLSADQHPRLSTVRTPSRRPGSLLPSQRQITRGRAPTRELAPSVRLLTRTAVTLRPKSGLAFQDQLATLARSTTSKLPPRVSLLRCARASPRPTLLTQAAFRSS